jgi:hypothetical protein
MNRNPFSPGGRCIRGAQGEDDAVLDGKELELDASRRAAALVHGASACPTHAIRMTEIPTAGSPAIEHGS